MKKQNLESRKPYEMPWAEAWQLAPQSLLKTWSTDLYLEGDIDGFEDIDEY